MKKVVEVLMRSLLLGSVVLLFVGCAKDEVGGISMVSDETAELLSVTNQNASLTFNAGGEWKATCSASWLTFSPKEGKAGTNTITLASTSTNRTKRVRSALLTIESDGKKKTVTVNQRDEYAVFEQEAYSMPAEGGALTLKLKTNVGELYWGYSSDMETLAPELAERKSNGGRTRTESEKQLGPLNIVPNTTRYAREGHMFLMMKNGNQSLLLDTVTITQEGMHDGYYSVDYAADGRVDILQRATQGKGIPIVLMGDGFQDREIADSTYHRVMRQAMSNIFSEEPIRSLRDYFNVYCVTAVSKHNNFGEGYSTAFSSVPNPTTTGIKADAEAVMRYVKKVEYIDSLNTLAVVILNTNQDKGVTYMYASNKGPINYAIALCPVIDNLESEKFRLVLTHEAVGHGFAKLADEYVRSTEGSATESDIKQLKERHEKWGWYLNVDSEKDSTKVIWSKMIFDDVFSNEQIGCYEGGYTFYKGIYRPTQESMMRSNNAPFNAPSRHAIYNKVMELGLGRTPTYEEFVEFDKQHKPTVWEYKTRTRQGSDVPVRQKPIVIIRN